MIRLFAVSALAALLTASGSPSPGAQNQCGRCRNGAVYDHAFYEIGCGPLEAYCYDCVLFNSCHGNYQDGFCTDFHWDCGTTGPGQMLAALEAGGVEEVLRTRPAEAAAFVNHARGALQVTDCRGTVVAHIPLTDSQVTLPSTAARMAA